MNAGTDHPKRLLVFGLGYTGSAIAAAARDAGFAVTGTSRDPASRRPPESVALVPYDAAGVAAATHVVTTIPVGETGDPVLGRYGGVLGASAGLRWAGYLSTTGVYGDRDGAWVDEDTEPAPASPRTRRRRAAELAWGGLPCAVDLFRSPASTAPAAPPSTRSAPAPRTASSSRAISSAASIATTSRKRCSPPC